MRLLGMRFALCGSRRAEDLALILERQGAIPLLRPTLQTVPVEAKVLVAQLRRFAREGADWLIVTTGMGLEEIYRKAQALGVWEGVHEKLREVKIAARGYKAERVLRQLGLRALVRDADGTVDGLIRALSPYPLAGQRVVVQLYGQPEPRLVRFLVERGARVEEFLPYRHLPAPEPELARLLEEILTHEVDAVVFTSGPQVEHFLDYARKRGQLDVLRNAFQEVWALAIGRVTALALEEAGIRAWRPQRERIGALVTEFAAFKESLAVRRQV
ncbi:uroporphyrinogen-III synthase [Thermus tengchongensis]|uniref:Uroporphyrinogen-III synthase n=1 Tax=Thermus tengchongensis TaxID=1214928 RepID=A0ABY2K3V2_9DEIN|nr:uroporphyrinogen-III synthase [Thermus tengchongensis]TFU14726.1 uroporphyrinogen-III synthase [Thermus tengchongensis]